VEDRLNAGNGGRNRWLEGEEGVNPEKGSSSLNRGQMIKMRKRGKWRNK